MAFQALGADTLQAVTKNILGTEGSEKTLQEINDAGIQVLQAWDFA
jgi:hypothetical protein